MGRFLGSDTKARMTVPPIAMPAPPKPAMARPMIKAVELGATPQSRLPTSKMNTLIRKVSLRGKYLNALPKADWKPPKQRKYAEPYQATSSSPPKSLVILGIAVPTMVWIG